MLKISCRQTYLSVEMFQKGQDFRENTKISPAIKPYNASISKIEINNFSKHKNMYCKLNHQILTSNAVKNVININTVFRKKNICILNN